jgi:plastocyanin domain-containing protein
MVASAVAAVVLAPACGKRSEPPESMSTPILVSQDGARVTAGAHGFAPSSLSLPKGAVGSTVPLTFVRTTEDTCAREVIFPEVGIKRDLPLNTPVTIDIPADAARTLVFQCGMGMYKGAVVVR